MNKVIPVLNYSTFYDGFEVPSEPISMLEGYDVEIVILTMVGLRNSLERNSYRYEKDGAMAAIMANLPPERSARLKHLIFGNPGFSLVQSPVIDKILADLFPKLLNQKIYKSMEDGQFEQRLLDLLLCYNELHYYNQKVEEMSHSHELMWSLVMMQGVSGVTKIDFARTGPIKHFIMLSFLRKSLGEKFNELEKSLTDNTGLENIDYFLGNFLGLFAVLERQQGKEMLVPHIGKGDPLFTSLVSMGLVINHETIAEGKFDIGQMLARPFFQISNGSMYVIDHRNFSLLLEQTFMYMLYHKSSLPKLAGLKNINGLYSHFGKQYYEKFLMHKLLTSLERPGVRIISSDDIHLADFTVIINETDVFVIEVKSVDIHYKVFDGQDCRKFKDHIDNNYVIGKGVRQLARNISYLKDDKHSLLRINNLAGRLTIYPIIVFTDPRAATYGVNDYVAETANIEFAKLAVHYNKVLPLTMIQSEFFVENSEILAKDRSLLKRLIKEYHFTIKRRKQRYEKVQSTENYIESMLPFDRFVVGRDGIYSVPHDRMFLHLGDVFGLKDGAMPL